MNSTSEIFVNPFQGFPHISSSGLALWRTCHTLFKRVPVTGRTSASKTGNAQTSWAYPSFLQRFRPFVWLSHSLKSPKVDKFSQGEWTELTVYNLSQGLLTDFYTIHSKGRSYPQLWILLLNLCVARLLPQGIIHSRTSFPLLPANYTQIVDKSMNNLGKLLSPIRINVDNFSASW